MGVSGFVRVRLTQTDYTEHCARTEIYRTQQLILSSSAAAAEVPLTFTNCAFVRRLLLPNPMRRSAHMIDMLIDIWDLRVLCVV